MTTKTIKNTKTTDAKTETPPKVAAKTAKAKGKGTQAKAQAETETKAQLKEEEAKTETTETALTMAEVLWDLAPDLGWEEKVAWMDHWAPRFQLQVTSLNAGRLTGPTTLYTEAAARLSKKGYRVRRQSGLGRSWLYISR